MNLFSSEMGDYVGMVGTMSQINQSLVNNKNN